MIGSSFADFIARVAVLLPIFLVALTFHEFAHGYAAYLLGDNTAKKLGRLTLNPFAHLDFFGTLMLVFVGFGWAKPVPFDFRNFKKPRLYSVITALAGPFTNYLLAYVSFLLLRFLPIFNFAPNIYKTFIIYLEGSARINVMLGTFNLLPIPPLDGSHFIFAMLYKKFPNVIVWLYRYSIFILLFIVMMPATHSLLRNLIQTVEAFIASLVF